MALHGCILYFFRPLTITRGNHRKSKFRMPFSEGVEIIVTAPAVRAHRGPENNYGAFFSSQEIMQGLHAGTVQQRECNSGSGWPNSCKFFILGLLNVIAKASPQAQKGATGIDPVRKHFLREMLR